MPLPGVDIEILNNQIGASSPSDDGIMGLILSGVAAAGIALLDPKQIFSVDDAAALGLDAAYDTTNSLDVHKQINEFYLRAARGQECWVMLVSQTTTMADACNRTNNIARVLLDRAPQMSMVGITRTPDAAYIPTFVDGIDDDVNAAVLNAHELCQEYAGDNSPLRFLVGARAFQGVPADLRNFRANTQNRCGVVLGSLTTDGDPAVGFTLGQFSNRPVQRNIGRVKDGDLAIGDAYFTNGMPIENYQDALDSIHDKGYIFMRSFKRRNGYWFNDDASCAPLSDDYAYLARGRVIDKAQKITYDTFLNEIHDDLDIDDNGFMDPAVVKTYEGTIEEAIGGLMLPGEISGVRCIINPEQNLLANNTVRIERLGVRPKGYAKFIYVPLGFDNPFNNTQTP